MPVILASGEAEAEKLSTHPAWALSETVSR